MVVQVNRLKKFNQREESPTVTSPNNQQRFQDIKLLHEIEVIGKIL
jgi:hypothetical protein